MRAKALGDAIGVRDLSAAAIADAFRHQSASRERGGGSNERLEFLGDAVLGHVVAAWLLERYPSASEGELARRRAALVNEGALAQTARRLEFSRFVQLGEGERLAGGAQRDSILADCVEALIGVIQREAGFEAARRFIVDVHLAAFAHDDMPLVDPKSTLQELAQARFACLPRYREAASGPPHRRAFVSSVTLGGKLLGRGTGLSKKAAQQMAAQEALRALGHGA